MDARGRGTSGPADGGWSEGRIVVVAGLVASSGIVLGAFGLDASAAAVAAHLSPAMRSAAEVATRFGKSDWLLVPSGLVLLGLVLALRRPRLRPGRRASLTQAARLAGFVFLAVAVTGLVAVVLKYGLGFARPGAVAAGAMPGFGGPTLRSEFSSFPSGHSTTMGTLFAILVLLWPASWPAAAIVTIAVALSRVAVGAHHLSDVAAGWLLGAWLTIAIAAGFARRGWLFVSRPGLPPRRRRGAMRAVRCEFTKIVATSCKLFRQVGYR